MGGMGRISTYISALGVVGPLRDNDGDNLLAGVVVVQNCGARCRALPPKRFELIFDNLQCSRAWACLQRVLLLLGYQPPLVSYVL